jgi:hypothetical protein
MQASTFEDFSYALRRKLIREISPRAVSERPAGDGRNLPPELRPAGQCRRMQEPAGDSASPLELFQSGHILSARGARWCGMYPIIRPRPRLSVGINTGVCHEEVNKRIAS